MDTSPLGLILTQGPLGIVAGIFIWLFLSELKNNKELTKQHAHEIEELYTKLNGERENQYVLLDGVRQAQIAREQDVAQTLKEYGKSVVIAIDQTTLIAQELRRAKHDNK